MPFISNAFKCATSRRSVSSMPKHLGKGSSFIDFKRIKVCAGNGGDGAIAFFKGPRLPMGPPSGGNGGAGGNIFIQACKSTTSLNNILDFYLAENGCNGAGKQMHGKNGTDTTIIVPVGTIVRQFTLPVRSENNSESSSENNSDLERIMKHFKFRSGYVPQQDRINMLLERIPQSQQPPQPIHLDLIHDGQRQLIARGGRGGYGNPHFLTQSIHGPAIASRGSKTQPIVLDLELKTISDIGLVGFPNAGKSTLLKSVSNTHPRIAPYPFTTLNPYIGTIDFYDQFSMTMADMPGIILGAHKNKGLGHQFLRHIERTKIIVYVIDIASASPVDDYMTLKSELELFEPSLIQKPSVVIANKSDVPDLAKRNLDTLAACVRDVPIIPVSALHEVNVGTMTSILRNMVQQLSSS